MKRTWLAAAAACTIAASTVGLLVWRDAPSSQQGQRRADTRVPIEVVTLLESAPGNLDDRLAPEAAAPIDDALPTDATLTVRPGSWIESEVSATTVVDVASPDRPAAAYLVLLARTSAGWRISATLPYDGDSR